MTLEGSIARPIPGIMALGVLGRSMEFLPRKGKKPMGPKKMVKGFVDIMVGTSLIGPVATQVNLL